MTYQKIALVTGGNRGLGRSETLALAAEHTKTKRIDHPEVGLLEIHCQTLFDVDQSHGLLVFTATPGSKSAEKAPAAHDRRSPGDASLTGRHRK